MVRHVLPKDSDRGSTYSPQPGPGAQSSASSTFSMVSPTRWVSNQRCSPRAPPGNLCLRLAAHPGGPAVSSVLLWSLPWVGSPARGSTPPFRLPQAFLLCRAWELKLSVPDPFAARVWGQVSLHQAQSHRAGGERGPGLLAAGSGLHAKAGTRSTGSRGICGETSDVRVPCDPASPALPGAGQAPGSQHSLTSPKPARSRPRVLPACL